MTMSRTAEKVYTQLCDVCMDHNVQCISRNTVPVLVKIHLSAQPASVPPLIIK